MVVVKCGSGEGMWNSLPYRRLSVKVVVGVVMGMSVIAGIVLSLFPVGPCNHSWWQWGCVLVLYPSITAAACIWDANTWEFQRHAYLMGLGQAGFIPLIYLGARAALKRTKGAERK